MEIKFRAFYKPEKKMYDLAQIDFKYDNYLLENPNNIRDTVLSTYDKIELMLFTGFYDKNGKEVFGGDVLKSDYEEGYIYWVVFENGGFYIYNDLGRYGSIERAFEVFEQYGINVEVIGNIYENKELLKQ